MALFSSSTRLLAGMSFALLACGPSGTLGGDSQIADVSLRGVSIALTGVPSTVVGGGTYTGTVAYSARSPGFVQLRLISPGDVIVATQFAAVSAGKSRVVISVTLPVDLAAGAGYHWDAHLFSDAWADLAQVSVLGVTSSGTATAPAPSTGVSIALTGVASAVVGGGTYSGTVAYSAPSPGFVQLRLISPGDVIVATQFAAITAGQSQVVISVTLPVDLAVGPGFYWNAHLFSGSWADLAQVSVQGVTSSGTATAPPPSSPATVTPMGVPGAFTLTWSDEFNGTSIDPNHWVGYEPWQTGGWSADETYFPVPSGDLATVSNGELTLRARLRPNAAGKPLQSAMVTSRDRFNSFTHGYIEARLKIPGGADLWPAFWLLGNGTGSIGWPLTGEVDIFEFVNNGGSNGIPFFTTHYAGPCDAWNHCQYTYQWPAVLPNYATGYHVFGLLRTATELTVYIDGVKKHSEFVNAPNPQGQPLPGNPLFDAPMHIRFDLSAGGWADDPAKAPEEGDFVIDYVRVFSGP